jgi:3-methyladenine DNA glycosylase AlkD
VKRIDNWAHSDGLSSFYAKMFLAFPLEVYSQLLSWSESKNLWERRQSVVVIAYVIRNKKALLSFDESIENIEKLFMDKEYFVQKGIGWALREICRHYPEDQPKFMYLKTQQMNELHSLCHSNRENRPYRKRKLKIIKRKKARSKS